MIEIWTVIILTIAIEFLTLFNRFFLKLSSKEIYIKIIKRLDLKFFVHVHHSIFGLVLAIVSYYFGFVLFFNFGVAMILSDAIHHVLVLWPILGHPEFHIVYRNYKKYQKETKEEKRKLNKFMAHLIHSFE